MKDENTLGGNKILNGLDPALLQELKSKMEWIDAPHDFTIFTPYEPIKYVYFPLNAMISMVAGTSRGQSAEIGVIGCEGAAGIEALMGHDVSPFRSMIQIAGPIYRLEMDDAKAEFALKEGFHAGVLSYHHKYTVQVSQTTLCNRLHQVSERLPRWLLMCQDRVQADSLLLTQEFIAMMLGTSRVTVTQAAHKLQRTGMIKYSRGRIRLIDRTGLESAACECYRIVKTEYERQAAVAS